MNYYFLSILIPFQLSHLLQSLFADFVLKYKNWIIKIGKQGYGIIMLFFSPIEKNLYSKLLKLEIVTCFVSERVGWWLWVFFFWGDKNIVVVLFAVKPGLLLLLLLFFYFFIFLFYIIIINSRLRNDRG